MCSCSEEDAGEQQRAREVETLESGSVSDSAHSSVRIGAETESESELLRVSLSKPSPSAELGAARNSRRRSTPPLYSFTTSPTPLHSTARTAALSTSHPPSALILLEAVTGELAQLLAPSFCVESVASPRLRGWLASERRSAR